MQAQSYEPGIHVWSHEEYLSDPCPEPSLSRSIADILMAQSPLHAWCAHPRLGNKSEPRLGNGDHRYGDRLGRPRARVAR